MAGQIGVEDLDDDLGMILSREGCFAGLWPDDITGSVTSDSAPNGRRVVQSVG